MTPACSPDCEGCWLQRHDGHDIATHREDGRLVSATCHDCHVSYARRAAR